MAIQRVVAAGVDGSTVSVGAARRAVRVPHHGDVPVLVVRHDG